MRKVGRYAALVVNMNRRRQNLVKRVIQYINVERAFCALTSRLRVGPEFGNGGSPNQQTECSGQSSSLKTRLLTFSLPVFLAHQTSIFLALVHWLPELSTN